MNIFCPLASGSKGNALYLQCGDTKVLIDAGIPFHTLSKRLGEIDVDIREIEALLITHEHGDHIRGVEGVVKRLGIPVFANGETAKAVMKEVKGEHPRFKIFSTGDLFEYGDLSILPFSIQHDTLDPVAFTFCFGGLKLGVCTDLGFVSTLVKKHLEDCDYLYLEANHEPSMVHASPRPSIYKKRVLGRLGHLSNDACASLIRSIDREKVKSIYLAHLSSECNHPDLARKKAQEALEGRDIPITIARQECVSTLLAMGLDMPLPLHSS